ncbi:hypothetical protein [Arthrobacter sp.]|uniref:PKD domain-containing protein n=1 Tax=Arthrobacter sp. TaxID=1667 RepID=UPI002584A3D9|nr:hypothetical protein [Arthrobacter sp.]
MGVTSEIWSPAPGDDGYWTNIDVASPDDPHMYRHILACTSTYRLTTTMCVTELASCRQGKDGRLVVWERSLQAPSATNWEFFAGPTCIYSEKPRDILAEIAAQISHEFQKSPIQPATVGSQPGPHTLRGQETNFYADATEQQFNLTLLGQKVHITATPATYTWNYGDGTLWGPTISAGAPLPDDRIGEQTKTSHVYTATGHYAITVTTHFNGVYSVNGGPSLPIPGQGNIQSAPLSLTVWRAVTKNYADNCNQNPDGVGC